MNHVQKTIVIWITIDNLENVVIKKSNLYMYYYSRLIVYNYINHVNSLKTKGF